MFERKLIVILLCIAPHIHAKEIQPISEIENEVEAFVLNALKNEPAPETFSVQIQRLSAQAHMPKCEVPLDISLDQQRIYNSHVSTRVTCSTPQWSLRVPVTILQYKPVAVAMKNLAKGEILTQDAVGIKSYNVKQLHESYYESLDDVQNMVLQRSIQAGTVITNTMIKKPVLVHRGDQVRIVYQSPGLRIESFGVAQADGIENQFIKVKNSRSNLLIDAQVKDKGMVIIPL